MKITEKSITVISEYVIEDSNGDEYIVHHNSGADDYWVQEWDVMTVDNDIVDDDSIREQLIELVKKQMS